MAMPRLSNVDSEPQDSERQQSTSNASLMTRPARPSGRKTAAPELIADKPVALTVKVDQPRYEALKVLGARTRRSNQEILLAALDVYLQDAGDGGPSNVRPTGGHLE